MDATKLVSISVLLQLGIAVQFPTNHVYHGDHFDELVIHSKDLFSINTILVIYGYNCQKDVLTHGISNQGLPPNNFMLLLKYHSDKAKELNWIDMDEDQDLKRRYNSTTCLDVMFFKRSSGKNSQPKRWYPENNQSFTDWVWQEMAVRIGFVNELDFPLYVHFESLSIDGPVVGQLQVASKNKKIIHLYPASIALLLAKTDPASGIDDKGNVFVDAKIIKIEAKFMVSVPTKRKEKPSEYVSKMRKLHQDELGRYNSWISNHQKRTLINMFQPQLLPTFRKDGYQVLRIPKEFHMKFVRYYMKLSKSREEVICNEVDAALNPKQYTNNCSVIRIEPSFKSEVLPQIQKYAESFCNCKLKGVYLKSIQMHHRDNFVYRSLTEPQNGAITVLLQIMKDSNSLAKNPWLMELTLPGGGKMAFDLDMAEMLIYESARLIFGRPKPLKAPVHIEITAHFVPISNWDYSIEDTLKEIEKNIIDDKGSEHLKDEL